MENIELIESNCITFYIRAVAETFIWDEIMDIDGWKTVTLAADTCQIG